MNVDQEKDWAKATTLRYAGERGERGALGAFKGWGNFSVKDIVEDQGGE